MLQLVLAFVQGKNALRIFNRTENKALAPHGDSAPLLEIVVAGN